MKSRRSLMVFGLALAVFQLLQVCPVQAVTMDDFNDNLRSVIWAYKKVGEGVYVSEKNNHVEFTITPTATGVPFYAEFMSRFQLKANFDIIVNFRADPWPLQSGVSVGIKTPVCSLTRTSLASGEFIAFTNLSNGNVTVDKFPTNALAGKLRLKRIGNTLTAYCSVPESSNQWHPLKSITSNTLPLTVELIAGSAEGVFSHQKVVASLDNFVINSGYLLWP